MIDRVAIIWANGSASVDWPLTDELYKLEHVAALTAVFGPIYDKLAKFTAVQESETLNWYRVLETGPAGVSSYTCEWETVLSDLALKVDSMFGIEPDRSGFHKEDK